MEENSNDIISNKALDRYFKLSDDLFKFSELFKYNEGDDRAIVIIGGSFLDIMLDCILLEFFPEDDEEVKRLTQFDQPMGTFGNKVRMAYCLGLIEKVIKNDLKLIGKIRNKFAHDLYATFEDKGIKSLCTELKWHKISMMVNPPKDATIRDLYQVGVNQIVTYLNGAVRMASFDKRKIKDNF